MNHILVLPDELRVKLNEAYTNPDTLRKWRAIGVNTVNDMLTQIVDKLNQTYPVLSITQIEEKSIADIKADIDSAGNASKFVGYFKNEKEDIDALFFYIPPDASNANDFIPAKVMPPLFGVFNNIKMRTRDRHLHCMPVFIVNLCTTTRVTNASVKKQIVCCETCGFNYYDIFQNMYHDVIGKIDPAGNMITEITSLHELDDLLGNAANNKWFFVDDIHKTIKILSTTINNSTNATADIYRLGLYVIPAVYLGSLERYTIDITDIANLSGDVADTLRTLIAKL